MYMVAGFGGAARKREGGGVDGSLCQNITNYDLGELCEEE